MQKGKKVVRGGLTYNCEKKRSERPRRKGKINPILKNWGFPGGSAVKASACNAGDLGSIPGWGRSPG